jgi:hypothetical protein
MEGRRGSDRMKVGSITTFAIIGKYCLVRVYSEKQTMTTLKLCSHSVHVHWLRVRGYGV